MPTTYCSLLLKYGSVETELSIPKHSKAIYYTIRDEFIRAMPDPKPSTPPELLAKFMGFVATLPGSNKPGGPYDLMLNHILLEFRKTYFKKNIGLVRLTESVINGSFNSVGRRVDENIIKNYYIALARCEPKPRTITPEMIHNGSNKTQYAVFYGLGEVRYFVDLSRSYNWFGMFLNKDLLEPICAILKAFAKSKQYSEFYPQGFDFINWIRNPEQRPDVHHLLSAPVACPLSTLDQLIAYAEVCYKTGLTPGEHTKYYFVGTTGHSQGIIASLVIALSNSWDSYWRNSMRAVTLMFFIGVRVALKFPSTISRLVPEGDAPQNSEGNPSSMLLIRDFTLDQVQTFVSQTNMDFPEPQHVAISIFNGPTTFVVSGSPESLYALVLILRKYEALNEKRKGKFKCSCEFLQIYAPFHSPLLKDCYKQIVEDCADAGIEFCTKDIGIPLYDTHNGANLQDYDKTTQEYSLTSRIIKLIIELPVHWEAAANFEAKNYYEVCPHKYFSLFRKTHVNSKYYFFVRQGDQACFERIDQTYRLHKGYFYNGFLASMSANVKKLIQSESLISSAYPHGLDFLSWLQNPEQAPDKDYLTSPPVYCPVLTIFQLAEYSAYCNLYELTPGQHKETFDYALGRGQGIVAAVVIALSTSWDSFLENSLKAVSLMLFIGARVGTTYSSVSLKMIQDSIKNDESRPSSKLRIHDLTLEQVDDYITQANKNLPKAGRIVISNFNGPKNFSVAGPPESLYALALILRENRYETVIDQEVGPKGIFKAWNQLSSIFQNKKAPIIRGKQLFWFLFVHTQAPFNSFHLKDLYGVIVKDLDSAGVEFTSKDIRIPVYDCHNYANLQDYDKLPQEYSLTSRLVKLVIELPVRLEDPEECMRDQFKYFHYRDNLTDCMLGPKDL